MLLDRLEHFLDVVVRISRVGEVHTHQFDALAVYHDRGGDGPFVDVLSIDNSLPPLLIQHNSNTVFVVVFTCFHEYVFVMCRCVSQISELSCLHVSLKNIASHL